MSGPGVLSLVALTGLVVRAGTLAPKAVVDLFAASVSSILERLGEPAPAPIVYRVLTAVLLSDLFIPSYVVGCVIAGRLVAAAAVFFSSSSFVAPAAILPIVNLLSTAAIFPPAVVFGCVRAVNGSFDSAASFAVTSFVVAEAAPIFYAVPTGLTPVTPVPVPVTGALVFVSLSFRARSISSFFAAISSFFAASSCYLAD